MNLADRVGRGLRLALCLAATSWLLAGCPLAPSTSPREELMEAVRGFNEGVHWGNIEPAGRFVAAEVRPTWFADAERVAREVSYSFYEVKRIELLEKSTKANVRVEIGWFHRTALIERKTTIVQRWVRRKGLWLLGGSAILDGPPVGG